MKYAFSHALMEQANANASIVLLTGDLGYTVFEPFKDTYPSRFFNMGVAEANMLGVACGMARSGLIPVVYSIASFATMRGYEQMRTDICVHASNVKIVGTGAGLSYGHGGSTHHAIEDIAILRCLPTMTILCPSDPIQAKMLTKQMFDIDGPVYLRLGKKGEPRIYKDTKKFTIGKGITLRKGRMVAIIATGNIVHNALLAADLLSRKGIHPTVIDMHTLKPLDKKCIENLIKTHHYIFTVEEHFLIGGLGSAVSEVIAESTTHKKILFDRLGIADTFINVIGSQEYLREKYGLSPQKISAHITKFCKKYG